MSELVPPAARLTAAGVRAIARDVVARCDQDGRASTELRDALWRMQCTCTFSVSAQALFQDLLARVGAPSSAPVALPRNKEPFWFRSGQALANFRSHVDLPTSADVVVIGAGLTGASAAYHLAEAARDQGLRIVVLERGDPAGEASGRNGGNFQLLPENAVGAYEGLAHERRRFLRRCHPGLPREVLDSESERQASLVLGLALRNRGRFQAIVRGERIACDFSPRGWLHLAQSEWEEQGICDEVTLAAQHGERIELWSRRRVREEFGFATDYVARFVPGDGTYHPFKYAIGLLQSALRSGVELYTHVRVREVVSKAADRQAVVTEGGTITCRCAIVATNAFTSQLFPELRAIRPYQSQIMLTEHVPDRTRGRVVTTETGPVYFNQPREGVRHGRAPLVFGGGHDRPMHDPASRRRSPSVHAQLIQLRDTFYPELRGQPPTSEWIGPMGYTPDQLPVIGFLRPGVIVAAGYNGYGGSYTTAAGQAAAIMATTGQVPEWVPEDLFSPHRLLEVEPLFLRSYDSLWRIAASLCRQVRAVNQHFVEAFLSEEPAHGVVTRATWTLAACGSRAGASVDPDMLRVFREWRGFTRAELQELLALTRCWEAPKGTVICEEDSPGGSCFIVVRGSVDVSTEVRGQHRRLARLGPGSIFGQISLIDGEPRSATCSAQSDAVLLELEREPCARLLESRSPTALKLLGVLNDGLIRALRGADRRLLRFGEGGFG